jgi:hypothetical protein
MNRDDTTVISLETRRVKDRPSGEQRESNAEGALLQFPLNTLQQEEVPSIDNHELVPFLEMLAREDVVSPREYELLWKALTPLMELMPGLTDAVIEEVRDLYSAPPKPTKYVWAREEENLWKQLLTDGENPIPGFDMVAAHSTFDIPPEQRAKKIHFLKPEFERELDSDDDNDIPGEVIQATVFFFICVRMFRLQHMYDQQQLIIQSDEPSIDQTEMITEEVLTEAPEIHFHNELPKKPGGWRTFRRILERLGVDLDDE